MATDVWKQYVFPIIVKTNYKPTTSIPLYMVVSIVIAFVNFQSAKTLVLPVHVWEVQGL